MEDRDRRAGRSDGELASGPRLHGGFGEWAADVSRHPNDIHEILERHNHSTTVSQKGKDTPFSAPIPILGIQKYYKTFHVERPF